MSTVLHYRVSSVNRIVGPRPYAKLPETYTTQPPDRRGSWTDFRNNNCARESAKEPTGYGKPRSFRIASTSAKQNLAQEIHSRS